MKSAVRSTQEQGQQVGRNTAGHRASTNCDLGCTAETCGRGVGALHLDGEMTCRRAACRPLSPAPRLAASRWNWTKWERGHHRHLQTVQIRVPFAAPLGELFSKLSPAHHWLLPH